MPFTLAHPAAVVPVYLKMQKRLTLASLVIGSMMPDAAYYFPMPNGYKLQAHNVLGALEYCVPFGLAALMVFYWIAPEIIFLLLNPHRNALRGFKAPALSVKNALVAICGLALGAETHVIWDSLTHEGGLMGLFMPSGLSSGRNFYFALQTLSSVIGLSFLLLMYRRWLERRGFKRWFCKDRRWRYTFWIAVLLGCTVIATYQSNTIHEIASGDFLYTKHFGLILVTVLMRSLLIAVFSAALLVKFFALQTDSRPGL